MWGGWVEWWDWRRRFGRGGDGMKKEAGWGWGQAGRKVLKELYRAVRSCHAFCGAESTHAAPTRPTFC